MDRTVTLKPRDDKDTGDTAKNDKGEVTEDDNKTVIGLDNIGLTVKNMTAKDKENYKVENGVLISKVKPNSAAQFQGLSEGIVIVKADKKKVDSVTQFKKVVDGKKGSAILLEVADSKGNTRFVGLEIPE